jgi:hypothetical protein
MTLKIGSPPPPRIGILLTRAGVIKYIVKRCGARKPHNVTFARFNEFFEIQRAHKRHTPV